MPKQLLEPSAHLPDNSAGVSSKRIYRRLESGHYVAIYRVYHQAKKKKKKKKEEISRLPGCNVITAPILASFDYKARQILVEDAITVGRYPHFLNQKATIAMIESDLSGITIVLTSSEYVRSPRLYR